MEQVLENIFIYSLKASIVLAILYLPYTLLMRRETFFSFNRAVLLTIVVISLVLPAIHLPFDWLTPEQHAFIEIGLPQILVEGQSTTYLKADSSPTTTVMDWLVPIFAGGLIVMFVLRSCQLLTLTDFISSGCLWTDKEDGARIYCHMKKVSSFSWMNKVVISADDYQSNPVILIHEKAHVRLLHSWDNLLVMAAEIFMWYNPCIWMLYHSLQEVHEYEADDHVLKSGITAKNYQLLLIEKAISTSSYAFANGFNHSLLKKRITMMSKKQSSKWSRTKALYLLPVAVIALGAFATPRLSTASMAVTDSKVNANVENYNDIASKNLANVEKIPADQAVLTTEDAIASSQTAITQVGNQTPLVPSLEMHSPANVAGQGVSETMILPNDSVFDVVENLPTFPGGMSGLMNYMSTNIKYPANAKELGIQGRIMVQFVVFKTGKVGNLKIVKGIELPVQSNNDLDAERARKEAVADLHAEALRMVSSMPDWTPGTQKGEKVNVRFTLPITFRLQ